MAQRDKEVAELIKKAEKDWNEKFNTHTDLLNLIESLPEDAPEGEKRKVLGIIKDKIRNQPADKTLKYWEEFGRNSWGENYHQKIPLHIVETHIKRFKKFVDDAIEKNAPPNDTEMAMGGRKKRRSKKVKKNRRYTRRR